MKAEFRGSSWRMSDAFWRQIQPLLPRYPKSPRGGRPRASTRRVMDGIFYVLRTGCQWKAMPREHGSGSTVHRYFQEWTERGVFGKAWKRMLRQYDSRKGIAWTWQSLDGSMTKAPLGGEKTGKNPTDRGKLGVKRSVLTDGRGMPIGVAIAGANTNDQKLFADTLNSIPVRRPTRSSGRRQHLCCDKGYDNESLRTSARRRGYIPHMRSRKDERQAKRRRGQRARRWVVERVASWMNRYRRILVRWEKKAANYLGFLHLVFADILWRNT